MTPAHDNRMNIGAKGLSGEAYKGHTFWDTEMFILPYFTFTDPAIAKKLEEYRYQSLPGAHKKAKGNNAGSVAGIWQCAVFGFGGVRMLDGRLRIRPALPEAWSRLEFTIFWQGSRLHVVETLSLIHIFPPDGPANRGRRNPGSGQAAAHVRQRVPPLARHGAGRRAGKAVQPVGRPRAARRGSGA